MPSSEPVARLLTPELIDPNLRSRAANRAGFEEEYPFASHWFEADGHVQHYIDEGQGPVLLMVHGNPTWSFAWRRLVADLSRDHRVIAIDHLGCGFSEKPQDRSVYTLDGHIQRLAALVKLLNLQNVTLFGHDWGGAIGMGCAGRLSERFERFVLMNTGAFLSQAIPFRIALCRIPVLGMLGDRGLNLFARAALNMAVEKPLTPAARAGAADACFPTGRCHHRRTPPSSRTPPEAAPRRADTAPCRAAKCPGSVKNAPEGCARGRVARAGRGRSSGGHHLDLPNRWKILDSRQTPSRHRTLRPVDLNSLPCPSHGFKSRLA